MSGDFLQRLKKLEGVSVGPPQPAREPVNPAMIRHWCEAMQDANPVYTDPEFAAGSVHGGIVAPPTMLQAWIMPGFGERQIDPEGPHAQLSQLLDEAGFTGVVATNYEQEYVRYLHPGDRVSCSVTLELISEEKQTALGTGHFLDHRYTFTDQNGEVVGTTLMRMLRFKPAEQRPQARPLRPALTHDNRFFWEGMRQGELRIQRCTSCGRLRHPPGPMCSQCQSLEWDAIQASGRGTVYSYVIAHHPPIPPFSYPNPIALVELEEGTRLVANLIDVEPADVYIGLPVRLEIERVDEDLALPRFRPDEAG